MLVRRDIGGAEAGGGKVYSCGIRRERESRPVRGEEAEVQGGVRVSQSPK